MEVLNTLQFKGNNIIQWYVWCLTQKLIIQIVNYFVCMNYIPMKV